jgi:predicted HD phosphohydrolase
MLGRFSESGKQLLLRSSVRFFSEQPHNIQAFHKSNLMHYCSQLPTFPALLSSLQAKQQFLTKQPVAYGIDLFLKEKISNPHFLSSPPAELMSAPLPHESKMVLLEEDEKKLQERLRQTLPPIFRSQIAKLTFYLLALVDVFDNQLAQRNYEAGLPDQENVSERVHGLQAAKMAALLGLPQDLIIAMLLHDIARPTHEEASHGHSNHHLEGAELLAPLGLSLPYTWYHAYAKFLLRECCPPYQALLSPVSAYSLSLQNKKLEPQINKLNALDSLSLAKQLYQLMFLRLFDDLSKVPALALTKKAEYLNDAAIRGLLFDQLSVHLQRLAKSKKDLHQVVGEFDAELDTAIDLLVRPKAYSNKPELYQRFRYLVEPLPGLKW